MIKTWRQRCDEHPDHDGIVSDGMIQARMQEEIDELRDAIEQEQEPVAWMNPSWIDPDTRGWASDSFESIQIEGWLPLYTAPRQWQGLTGEEVAELTLEHVGYPVRLTGAIEAKLKEKNT